nr:GGDEF domain-containing protein [Lachnospiraceae bacterium]
ASFLEKHEFTHEFELLIDYVEEKAKETGVANMRLQILNVRLEYERKHGKKEQYKVHLEEFFELYQWQQIASNKMNLRAVELGIALAAEEAKREEVERQNKILETRSTHDTITGLPNRYALNVYAEAAFERAFQAKTSFAIELLDVDCFKQYNDSYGHQKGDECLIMVADALKEVAKQDGIFAARFGGDEFAIIYEDFTDEDIKQIAEQLRLEIMNRHVPNANSDVMPFVTISQGIRNSVPVEGNKVWDFLYGADNALYQVKRNQKNNVHLVHKVTQVLYE